MATHDFQTLHTKAFGEPEGYDELVELLKGEEILTDETLQETIYEIHLIEVSFALSVNWSGELLHNLAENLRVAYVHLEDRKKKSVKTLMSRLETLRDMIRIASRAENSKKEAAGSLMLFGRYLRHLTLEPMPIEEFEEKIKIAKGFSANVVRRCEMYGWVRRTSLEQQHFLALTRDGEAALHTFRYALDKREASLA